MEGQVLQLDSCSDNLSWLYLCAHLMYGNVFQGIRKTRSYSDPVIARKTAPLKVSAYAHVR